MTEGGDELLREAEDLIEAWLCELDDAHTEMVAGATAEATRIVGDAEERAQRLTAVARDEAEEIVAAAHVEARRIIADAESAITRRRAEVEADMERLRSALIADIHPDVAAATAPVSELGPEPEPAPEVEAAPVDAATGAQDEHLLTALWAAAQPRVDATRAPDAPPDGSPSVLGSEPIALEPGVHRRKRRRLFGLGRR